MIVTTNKEMVKMDRQKINEEIAGNYKEFHKNVERMIELALMLPTSYFMTPEYRELFDRNDFLLRRVKTLNDSFES